MLGPLTPGRGSVTTGTQEGAGTPFAAAHTGCLPVEWDNAGERYRERWRASKLPLHLYFGAGATTLPSTRTVLPKGRGPLRCFCGVFRWRTVAPATGGSRTKGQDHARRRQIRYGKPSAGNGTRKLTNQQTLQLPPTPGSRRGEPLLDRAVASPMPPCPNTGGPKQHRNGPSKSYLCWTNTGSTRNTPQHKMLLKSAVRHTSRWVMANWQNCSAEDFGFLALTNQTSKATRQAFTLLLTCTGSKHETVQRFRKKDAKRLNFRPS